MAALIRVNDDDGYVDKLVKLVPAEAISAYLALINIAGVSGNNVNAGTSVDTLSANTTAIIPGNAPEVWYAFGIALFILVVARVFGSITVQGTRVDWSMVNWGMVGISIAAFFLWVYTIGGDASGPFKNIYSLFWGTALIILFTFLAPYIHSSGTKVWRKVQESS